VEGKNCHNLFETETGSKKGKSLLTTEGTTNTCVGTMAPSLEAKRRLATKGLDSGGRLKEDGG